MSGKCYVRRMVYRLCLENAMLGKWYVREMVCTVYLFSQSTFALYKTYRLLNPLFQMATMVRGIPNSMNHKRKINVMRI